MPETQVLKTTQIITVHLVIAVMEIQEQDPQVTNGGEIGKAINSLIGVSNRELMRNMIFTKEEEGKINMQTTTIMRIHTKHILNLGQAIRRLKGQG